MFSKAQYLASVVGYGQMHLSEPMPSSGKKGLRRYIVKYYSTLFSRTSRIIFHTSHRHLDTTHRQKTEKLNFGKLAMCRVQMFLRTPTFQ